MEMYSIFFDDYSASGTGTFDSADLCAHGIYQHNWIMASGDAPVVLGRWGSAPSNVRGESFTINGTDARGSGYYIKAL